MDNVTNENLYEIDWSAGDRKKFLLNFKAPGKSLINRGYATQTEMRNIWMVDVSAADPRSIKAQLSGCGDFRANWWNFSDTIYRICHPQADLHISMYAFHERHGRITIGILKFKILFKKVRQEIHLNGVVAGIHLLQAFSRSE